MKINLFVVTHKAINKKHYKDRDLFLVGPKQDSIYKDGDFKDNTLINISDKNYTYCECTAMYWLYKNYKCDYIGIEHYRRLFYKWNFMPIDKKYVKRKLKKYDFIVMVNWCLSHSNKDQFIKSHGFKMYEAMENAIKKIHPEYLESFNKVMKEHHLSWCNMMVTSKENYDKYCDFLFSILFEVEKTIEIPVDPYQRRIMGFISERMLNVYLTYHHELKVKQCLVLQTKRYLKE